MATTRGSLFDPTLVKDLVSKVTGKSSLAALCAQTPIPFNGMKEMIFSMDKEIDIVVRWRKIGRWNHCDASGNQSNQV